MNITIQPGQPGKGMDYDVHLPLPYPFHIDATAGNCTHGRGTPRFEPDLTANDRPWTLIGFQAGDTQAITLTRQEFAAAPHKAVGLVPVFLDHNRRTFALTVPITRVQDNR